MTGADSFSSSYSEAREKFLEAVSAADVRVESFKHPCSGPRGEELATDAAWFGPSDASRTLVLISGVHGVEGYCGSGAQVDWLRRKEFEDIPAGASVLMIHAINPYGFAWTRRTNEDNVDLNRNWLDFSLPPPPNPDYVELAETLCPAEWTSKAQEETARKMEEWRASRGAQGLDQFWQAVAGGQYSHPLGLFFGGHGPSWSRRTQTAIFQKYLSRARRVGIIDYHTGLGPCGYAERLTIYAPEEAGHKRAAKWFGAEVTSTKSGTAASKDVSGDSIIGSSALLPNAEITSICFEVGTAPPPRVLQALRADAWLHAHGDPESEQGRQIKAELRAAFYCETDFWKGMVAGQSLLACRQALAGLSLQPDVYSA
ncbi:M14 family metallopeptidase [Methylocystis bryophila]|uniref:DUF2817 domain-containing protein n=1 Tax=Methylocystis bryophila TaxID=655015 RepID=A0A1W6MVU9_9HYPH|nr:M14 family metallopeptidase [Methylocystis bryophila]ARN81687.1 hypothetical protein B1812_12055 [Methylocystis bryophila]BDV37736.1 hypothetical protein DSM21852_09890 [Methylocystis bryophila]